MTEPIESQVAAHYGRQNLMAAILDGLAQQGADQDALTPEDLAPVDEFHTAGRQTTMMALDMTPVAPGMRILDAGCGIGGTSRHLAVERGCDVEGIDLTPEYIDVATELAARMGLSDRCRFKAGSVLDLPYATASFDGVVTMHVAMNIQDRGGFYAQLARVTRQGGFLCLFDVMKGPEAGMSYPVPWSETEQTSFLKSMDETASLVTDAGFQIVEQRSLRDFAITFFDQMFARTASAGGPPPLGLHLLTGANTAEKFANYAQGLKNNQIEPAIMVARRT